MEDILTTKELLQVLKGLNMKISRARLQKHEWKGRITPYFKHPKFNLWRVDHCKAFISYLSKYRDVIYNEEDTDNVIKFVQGLRNENNLEQRT